MKAHASVWFALLAVMFAVSGVCAQETDKNREKELRELREKILRKVDERLKKETERIRAEIEQVLAEELGRVKPAETAAKRHPEIQVEQHGEAHAGAKQPGWFGSWVEPLSEELAAELGVKQTDGAVIADVVAGGPAEQAGLAKNDLVLSFNGTDIHTPEDLHAQVKATQAGQKVQVVVLRKGGKQTVDVAMGRRPGSTAGMTPAGQKKEPAAVTPKDPASTGKRPALRDRIKGFLDKMMTPGKGEADETEEADEEPATPKSGAAAPKKGDAAERLQARIRDFMNKMGSGKKDSGTAHEEGAAEDEDGEAEEGGADVRDLGEIARKFFDQILNNKKDRREGADEMAEGEADEDGAEAPDMDMTRMFEQARKFLEQNGGDMKSRLKELQEKFGTDGEGDEESGENGIGDMLKGLDLDQLPDQFKEMIEKGGWKKFLDREESEDGEMTDEDGEADEAAPAEQHPESAAKPGGAFLGVTLDEVSDELRAHYDLGDKGVIVNGVVDGSPAAKAGLKQWDIIVAMNGAELKAVDDLIGGVQKNRPGDVVKLTVLRRGKEMTLEATLAARPAAPKQKLVRPAHYVLADNLSALFAPKTGGDKAGAPGQEESKKKDAAHAKKPTEAQMREQLTKGLRLMQSLFRDREIYWQVATKDGNVFYRRKIDPKDLAELAKSGGKDLISSLIFGRRNTAAPGSPMKHSAKDGVRVFEAPGVRIEINESEFKKQSKPTPGKKSG